MTGRLQDFDFRSSPYERPTQAWECGRLAEGKPCRMGPGRRGVCRAGAECSPIREGDRWTCTRAPGAGGKCADGPRPDGQCSRVIPKCTPRRSLRARRARAVLWIAAVTVGLLVIALDSPMTQTLLSPGAVTLQHGEIGACAGCHQGFDGGPAAWVHAAFAPLDARADSAKCQGCHDMGAFALKAHSLPPDVLSRSTERLSGDARPAAVPASLSIAAALFDSPTRVAGDLACATCHREHQGRESQLTAMSDGRCQSCHAVKFAAFSKGHPEFNKYPYERRTRIKFDHVSHIVRHFEKAGKDKAPATCTGCHSPALDGRFMLAGGFAKTCAACHTEEIAGASQVGPKGVAFLVVPGFDLVELRARDAAIGEWPEWSEQKLTPFMEVLLAGRKGFGADIARLEGLDPLDLTDASDDDIAAIERIAWDVKGLIYDLLTSGADDARVRLAASLDQDMTQTGLLGRLLGTMPLDVIRAAQEAWFPNLFAEVERHRRGEAVPLPGDKEATGPAESPPPESAGAATDQETQGGDDILGGGDDILGGDENPSGGDDILGGGDENPSGGDDILGGDDDILGGDDDILSGDGDLADDGQDGAEPGAAEEAASAPEVDPEDWAKMGGWYRQDYALYFRPLGHADPFMRTWIDVGARAEPSASREFRAAVFTTLTDAAAPGKCAKCHSADVTADGALTMNWQSARPQPETKRATVFSHTTHFSMLDEQGCRTCHKLDRKADFLASFKDHDPASFTSNFSPLRTATCATCHIKGAAGDACLLCHRYHVGVFKTRPVSTEMAKGMTKPSEP